MKKHETLSKGKKLQITVLPYDGDMEAEQRIKTILELAVTIGRREGLIGNHITEVPDVSDSTGSRKAG